jgi:hypothetical protein
MMMIRFQSGRFCRDLFIVKAVRTTFIANFVIFRAPPVSMHDARSIANRLEADQEA